MRLFAKSYFSFNVVALLIIHLTRGEIIPEASDFPYSAEDPEPRVNPISVAPPRQVELQTVDISRHVCQRSGTGGWIRRSRYNNALCVKFGGTGTIPGAVNCNHTPGQAGSGCALCHRQF